MRSRPISAAFPITHPRGRLDIKVGERNARANLCPLSLSLFLFSHPDQDDGPYPSLDESEVQRTAPPISICSAPLVNGVLCVCMYICNVCVLCVCVCRARVSCAMQHPGREVRYCSRGSARIQTLFLSSRTRCHGARLCRLLAWRLTKDSPPESYSRRRCYISYVSRIYTSPELSRPFAMSRGRRQPWTDSVAGYLLRTVRGPGIHGICPLVSSS